MITAASSEWVLLSAVYHHVLARNPSPEAAKLAIVSAWRNCQLRLRCTLREIKAQPELRLAPGESPPPAPEVITPDCPIPPNTLFDDLLDWERSKAYRRDRTTSSLNEYLEITTHRDDVLALWPGAEPSATLANHAAGAAFGAPVAGGVLTEKPADVSARVWAVAKLLEKLEQQRGSGDIGISVTVLLEAVRGIAPRGMPISETTLRKARRYRRDPAKYCRQRAASNTSPR